jgi:hypothetical protein
MLIQQTITQDRADKTKQTKKWENEKFG